MKFRLALVLATAWSTPVLAADLASNPIEPPAPEVVAYSWTGFYAGAHLGGNWTGDRFHSASDAATEFGGTYKSGKSAAVSRNGFHSGFGVDGGVQAGYNYQVDRFVLGVEGNFDLTSGKDHYLAYQSSNGALATTSLKDSSAWNGSLRARFGYALDRWLPYVTAGVGVRNDKLYGATVWSDGPYPYPSTSGSKSRTQAGFVGGAGLEYALSEHWSVRGEVLYSWYPKRSAHFVSTSGSNGYTYTTTSVFKSQPQTVSFDLGVNYRF